MIHRKERKATQRFSIQEIMHYQNGREVKVGDSVVGKGYDGTPIAGVVVKTIPGATTCNISVVPVQTCMPTYNSGEFLHVEDAFAPKKEELA